PNGEVAPIPDLTARSSGRRTPVADIHACSVMDYNSLGCQLTAHLSRQGKKPSYGGHDGQGFDRSTLAVRWRGSSRARAGEARYVAGSASAKRGSACRKGGT